MSDFVASRTLEAFPFNPQANLRGEGVIVIAAGDRGIDERLRCAQGIRNGEVPVSKLVDQSFSWNDAPTAYAQLQSLKIQGAVLAW